MLDVAKDAEEATKLKNSKRFTQFASFHSDLGEYGAATLSLREFGCPCCPPGSDTSNCVNLNECGPWLTQQIRYRTASRTNFPAAATESETLAKSAKKGQVYAFIACEPDDADDVSEGAVVSKYWLGELATNVNRATRDIIPDYGTPIAAGVWYVKVKWFTCCDPTNLQFKYEETESTVEWDASVVRLPAVTWERKLRTGVFWLSAAVHREIVKQADIQIMDDNASDPDETSVDDGGEDDEADDNNDDVNSDDDEGVGDGDDSEGD